MTALKEVTVNLRPAVYGLISEIERSESIGEIRQLVAELRFWLDGDVLSVMNLLKMRNRMGVVNSEPRSVVVYKSPGDTPKIVITEMGGESRSSSDFGDGVCDCGDRLGCGDSGGACLIPNFEPEKTVPINFPEHDLSG